MFPIDRYRFYYNDSENPKTVYAVSTYAGKTVKGVAKCDDEHDEFSKEKGMELAAARCEARVAKKRLRRALEKYNEALAQQEQTNRYVQKMGAYLEDARKGLDNAEYGVKMLLANM